MNEEELKEALVKAGRIIDHWERQELDSNEAMEMLAPLLSTITAHVENVLDPAAAILDPSPGEEEYEVESERLQDSGPEPGDLFSKTESKEEENEDVKLEEESKSKSKKPKEFAGSDGSIPF